MTENKMMRVKRSPVNGWILLLRCVWLALAICALAGVSTPDAVVPVMAQDSPARNIYSKAFSYYNNDDTSDKAATLFSAVIKKYPGTSEAETAQYYLASYYQRKYYILKKRGDAENRSLLTKAQKGYRTYTDKYYRDGATWLSDSFFYQALAFLQLDDYQNAQWELKKMKEAGDTDAEVEIYEIIWSPDYGDVINAKFRTVQLAGFALDSLAQKPSFSDFVSTLKRWCFNERNRQQLRK